MPENAQAGALFLDMWTQWRFLPDGNRDGIDRAALQASIAMMGVRRPRELFAKLQIMEMAALAAWSEKKT